MELALDSDHRLSLPLLGIVLPKESKYMSVCSLLDQFMLLPETLLGFCSLYIDASLGKNPITFLCVLDN